MKRAYLVKDSQEYYDYREFLGSRIEGNVAGKAIEGLYGLGTSDLEDLFGVLTHQNPKDAWDEYQGRGGPKQFESED